ncbi:hypothetical protein D6T69_04480 [Tenacibaculum singaporense]|uniref:Uncharacterized protein n=1 Tax=Tenacibaculum singaporense TaxID=2358479 RepID=A0A3Q8RM85_9FLAO|nr:hypothetical protein D6T69_04480 [Tenacibaculum singaporense]
MKKIMLLLGILMLIICSFFLYKSIKSFSLENNDWVYTIIYGLLELALIYYLFNNFIKSNK